MITPDTKNWTWVLERPCPECGFDTSTVGRDDLAPRFRREVEQWRRIVTDWPTLHDRPAPDVWSPLEYACHVRDIFEVADERVRLMLEEDEPGYPDWDQDETALERDYPSEDPARLLDALTDQGNRLASRLEGIEGSSWERIGTRSDGSRFAIDAYTRYLIHDLVHHEWDVTGEADLTGSRTGPDVTGEAEPIRSRPGPDVNGPADHCGRRRAEP